MLAALLLTTALAHSRLVAGESGCALAAVLLWEEAAALRDELRRHSRLPELESFRQLGQRARAALRACWAKELDAVEWDRCVVRLHLLYFRVSLALEASDAQRRTALAAAGWAVLGATAACLRPLLRPPPAPAQS